MKKALSLLLTAFILVSLFISCAEPKVEITISFDGNGSTSGEMADLKAYKGEDVELTKNVFVNEGYFLQVGTQRLMEAEIGIMMPTQSVLRKTQPCMPSGMIM